MKNKIDDLRNHLFEMLETLKDPEAKVDIERLKLGNEVAQTIINSAKVGVDFMRTIGAERAATNFIPQERTVGPELPAPVRSISSKR